MSGAILVVEDDENLGLALVDNLESEGFRVELAPSGEAARAALAQGSLAQGSFDLIILDIMLPDTDGYTLCRELRDQGNGARVLMLTARTLEEDVVRGFEAGADDYVAKPYRLAELLARVSALLRRGVQTARTLRFGVYALDLDGRKITDAAGELVDLTRKEFDLLAYLLENRDRALPRQQILDDVWGADVIVDARTIDNFVSSLKKKLDWRPDAGYRIETVRGVGYRFELD
jgi:DNA-binding response OmpR family regulator